MRILELQDYSIHSGNATEDLNPLIDKLNPSSINVLVDDNTQRDCLPLLEKKMPNRTFNLISIKSGELNKTLDTCQHIWSEMMNHKCDRKALLINLGGGVIGDMGGFCASTFKRGIRFIQIPTTLLSQVDASVGGKLGIDFGNIKNSIGVFNNPQAVFLDVDFLDTLSFRELRSGYAEIIKHSLIADKCQWKILREIKDLKSVDWSNIAFDSVRIKQQIVQMDPFEKGIRKALNYGHTIGHAVESLALHTESPLLHGEAIAVGMICEAYLSSKQAGMKESELQELTQYILKIYGSDYSIPINKQDELIDYMENDKKNEGNGINFTLLNKIGKAQVNFVCSRELIIESMCYYNDSLTK